MEIQALQDFRDYFSRHFLGQVKVNSFSLSMEMPLILSIKRNVDTHPIRTSARVIGSRLFSLGKIGCSDKGFRVSLQLAKIKGAKIAKYALGELSVYTLPKIKNKLSVKDGRKRMSLLPQERANRLQWQQLRPKKEGEMLLAWFGPLVKDALVKLTLNKQRGTLLIWYNPQSRHFEVSGLYLYKYLRFRDSDNLEWRWM